MSDGPFGGHVSNPPEDCAQLKYAFENNGTIWLDISLCHKCDKIKTCAERKNHLTKRRRST